MDIAQKQAICIQCHAKPEIINFLIECMPAEQFDFYIHVDKKSDIYDQISKNSNICFADRIDVQWGQFSQVEATLSMFQMINPREYSYIHLISGSDFISKDPQAIISFFNGNKKEYIESLQLPYREGRWSWDGIDRYLVWYPQFIIKRPANIKYRILRVCWREFVMRTKIFQRRHLPVPTFYGGSQWFSITGDTLSWMMQYLSDHPDYMDFFRHGVCVDEVFFSTLIQYSPNRSRITNNNLYYMEWEGGTTGGPHTLGETSFSKIINSNGIWARKFDDIKVVKNLYKELAL